MNLESLGCQRNLANGKILSYISKRIEQDGNIDNIRHKINWNLNKRGYYKNFIIKEIKK